MDHVGPSLVCGISERFVFVATRHEGPVRTICLLPCVAASAVGVRQNYDAIRALTQAGREPW